MIFRGVIIIAENKHYGKKYSIDEQNQVYKVL